MTGSPTRTGRRSATSFVRWSSASRSLLIGFGSSSGLTRARQRHPNRAEICHIVQHVVALYRGQDRLALLQAEAQRRCGMPGWEALARADLVPLRRAVRPGQLQHDPPPHRAPAPQPPAAGIAPPRFWTVSAQRMSNPLFTIRLEPPATTMFWPLMNDVRSWLDSNKIEV